jgi:hypothetical protein
VTVDTNAIAAGLAGKYAAVPPPAGEPNIRQATHQPPQAITKVPFLLVARADENELSYGGQQRTSKIPFEISFYLETAADIARFTVRLQKWEYVLLDAPLVGFQLGLADHPGHVAATWPISSELGLITYNTGTWAGIRQIVLVQTSDGVTPTA